MSLEDQVFEAVCESTGIALRESIDKKGYEKIWFVDTASGIAILLNAMHIGGQANCAIHAEPCYMSAETMKFVDAIFAVGFAVELLIRRRLVASSWRSFFLTHEDANWHVFDTVVVGFSAFSVLFEESGIAEEGAGGFFSLFRLLRVTRLARVVRFFRVFKQLTVMLLSLLDGMKTVVWAALLLFLLMYMIAVLLIFTNEDLIRSLESTPYAPLFKSLPMIMYVLFECMSEGCGDTIVRPIVAEIGHEPLAMVFYPLFMLFTVSGVLNLFTAMFVDNTMEAARLNEDRMRQSKDKQCKILTKKLQKLVALIIAEGEGLSPPHSQSESEMGTNSTIASRSTEGKPETGGSTPALSNGDIITKQMFQHALKKPMVRKLLQDMEINDTEHEIIFDVLDANDNGILSIKEIVDGIVQVHGQARALDTVAVRLAMRAVQAQLRMQQESFDGLAEEMRTLSRVQISHGTTLKHMQTFPIPEPSQTASTIPAPASTASTAREFKI
jgi:hypothetical protein